MKTHWTDAAEGHLDSIYLIKPDQIDILAVIHGSQDMNRLKIENK